MEVIIIATALVAFLTGPDQVVAVAISQDNWQIVAAHLGILKAGSTMMFLDTVLPEALITHMLKDAQPVVIITRGQDKFRDLPTLDIRTQRVQFLGRADAQLKVRGHRGKIQPVEDILQTQFIEIEAAVLDYQKHELVAFVSVPSISKGDLSIVAPAPAEWTARVTAILARQLPEPSVPTRIFLVENFVMKPMSGKIDRERLPNLSHLLTSAKPETEDQQRGQVKPPDADAGVVPYCEEVLAICRAVFETSLGWDDVFADNGGHSIVIARLAQRLQVAGWAVPVRALLSDCNTPRKVANHPHENNHKPHYFVHHITPFFRFCRSLYGKRKDSCWCK